MSRIGARAGQVGYGMGVGVVLLDEDGPGFAGEPANPSGYSFPIQYEIARGVDRARLGGGGDCRAEIESAARRLQDVGCRAVVGECVSFARFQEPVAAALRVPVFLSTLLQVPWAHQLIGADRSVGILVTAASRVTEDDRLAVGLSASERHHFVTGLTESGRCPRLARLDREPSPRRRAETFAAIASEVVDFARGLLESRPDVGALVLASAALAPFARALQGAVGLPLYSAATLVEYAYSVAVHRDFYGHV